MEWKLSLLVGLSIVSFVQHVTASTEALLECGRVHQIDNIANLSTATASYSNSQCMLVCVIGSAILPVDSIHEGRSCPEDTNGICRTGQCIGGQEDALRECGLRHSVDFHKVDNHQGTAFANDQCALRCVLGGTELPVSHMHEGATCPANHNGICSCGSCVAQSSNPGSTVTPIPSTIPKLPTTTIAPTTTVAPTTVTQPSISLSFSPSKMKLLNVSLESTDPFLKQNQRMLLYFYESPSRFHLIADIHGNPEMPYNYYLQSINDIPSKLTKYSFMSIELVEPNVLFHTDLYLLFAIFYQTHKLAFGEQENFVVKHTIHQKDNRNVKLMDVSLRYTIVFSKD